MSTRAADQRPRRPTRGQFGEVPRFRTPPLPRRCLRSAKSSSLPTPMWRSCRKSARPVGWRPLDLTFGDLPPLRIASPDWTAGSECRGSEGDQNGADEDAHVGHQGHRTHVRFVQVSVLGQALVSGRRKLPDAGDARTDLMARVIPQRICFDYVNQLGSRADQAHVATNDVPQLGEFVHARGPQQPSQAACGEGRFPDLCTTRRSSKSITAGAARRSGRMVRNLYILNTRPCRPTRSWVRSAGRPSRHHKSSVATPSTGASSHEQHPGARPVEKGLQPPTVRVDLKYRAAEARAAPP